MKSYLDAFMNEISEEFLKTHTQVLMTKELPQTTPATHDAADYIYSLLKENGFEAQRLNFVSDGKTACQDKIMPMCWDATYGRLTVTSEWEGERVIADYEKEPFSLVRFSVSTPEGGLKVRLVTWDQMQKGADVKGAFVSIPQGMLPTDKAVVPILNNGAVGIVSGTVCGAKETPDAVLWANNCSETNSWYVNADERPFVAFCVTPRILEKLEKATEKGEVILKAETDSHRYEGKMPAVTALLKGESEREFWVMAHTAEPLEDDNSAGVISCIHSLISIRDAIEDGKIPPLKYSIRVLFAPELYGFAAFAEHFGGVLRDRCIGALCVDGMPICSKHIQAIINFATPAIPFYGNVLIESIWNEYRKNVKQPPFVTSWGDHWGDDCFMSDTSVGLPTIMPEYDIRYLWHNSCQRYDYIDYPQFARVCAVYTAFIASVAAYDSKKYEKLLPMAVAYASTRLAETAMTPPPRAGTDAKARLMYCKNIELNNIKAFSDARVDENAIKNACTMLENFVDGLTPIESELKSEDTPIFDSCENIVPKRTSIGIPHDFARVPLEKRWHPVTLDLFSRVFSAMDGEKTLKTLVREAEWEQRNSWSEEEIADYIETLKFMAEFGYVELEYKFVQ